MKHSRSGASTDKVALGTKIKRKYGRYWQLYLFLLLPVVWVILFKYYPMYGLQIAFKKYKLAAGIAGSQWVGFKNFTKFFNAYQFWAVLKNTVTISFYAILAAFPFPILFALILNTIRHQRFKKAVQTITYIPHFISTVVLVGMLLQVFNPQVGLYGAIVKSITGSRPEDLFASPAVFPHMYVWSGVWQGFGYNSIIYVAALSNVSPELHEAAEVDGASRFQRILHVDLPAIIPTITIMLILRTGTVMSIGFEKAYLMQNSLNLSTSEIISTFVYKKGIGAGASNDYSYATAVDMFNSIVNLALITSVNAISRRISDTSLW